MANCKDCMHWNRCERGGKTPFYGKDIAVDKVEEACRDFDLFTNYVKIPAEGIGELSDGYHTFNELYHHRAILFSVICNMFPDKAWKSKLHDTGDMFDGMFIVGIETERGQATYHYDTDLYWNIFNVRELDRAPAYDGHTPAEAISRISTLRMTSTSVIEEVTEPEDVPEETIVSETSSDVTPAESMPVDETASEA